MICPFTVSVLARTGTLRTTTNPAAITLARNFRMLQPPCPLSVPLHSALVASRSPHRTSTQYLQPMVTHYDSGNAGCNIGVTFRGQNPTKTRLLAERARGNVYESVNISWAQARLTDAGRGLVSADTAGRHRRRLHEKAGRTRPPCRDRRRKP